MNGGVTIRSVRLDHGAVDRLLHARGGPVGRTMAIIGASVTRDAKAIASRELSSGTSLSTGRSSLRYRDSFSTTTVRMPGGLRTRVSNRAPHAGYLEKGTRPHLILPRRGQFLRFTGKSGAIVFARVVHHPGTKPYRIMERALRTGVRKALVGGSLL